MNPKKLFLFIVTIILVGIFGLISIRQKLGNLLPAVLPAAPKISTINSIQDTTTGLTIPEGYTLKVLTNRIKNARDLQLIPSGVLLISSPAQGKIYAIKPDGQLLTILDQLDRPHGMAFLKNHLYIAQETRVDRYVLQDESSLDFKFDKKILDLPKGDRHFSRSLVFDKNQQLYVSLGSSCDTCFEEHPWLAAVITSDADGNNPKVFSNGLRNPVFLALNPQTNQVWATEMGRDFLGDNLPPDEINILQSGHFGWPVCYGDKVYDQKFAKESPKFCDKTIPPVFHIPAHSAPLGLTFINSPQFPNDWQGDLLVAYHGSWNSSTPVGYKIVRLEIEDGKVTSSHDFITGFLQGNQAIARPVDMEFGSNGELYFSDDKSGSVYVLIKK